MFREEKYRKHYNSWKQGGGEGEWQTMYTHVSKCKMIKEKKENITIVTSRKHVPLSNLWFSAPNFLFIIHSS
jgi:hypothetical protein